MPNFIRVGDFRGKSPLRDPCMYFSDAYRGMNDYYKFTIENEYPFVASIHIESLEDHYSQESRQFWIDLRKWVERTCAGDVLYDYTKMDYNWWWNREAKKEWDKAFSVVKHGYWHFYFECESDYTMFTLKHGDKFTTVQKYHPDFGADVLEQDKIYGKAA